MRRAAPAADEGGGFEAVHPRHVDVEQDDGEIALQDPLQCLLARFGHEQWLTQLLQDGLVDEPLVGTIVDDKDVGPGAVGDRSSGFHA